MEKDERQVAEWYNTLSNSYDELYGQEQSQKYETVLEFLGNRHFRVLVDIGCGTGAFLEKAHETYDYAIGIDLSSKMLQIARRRKTPNTDYAVASSSSLPLKDNSVDCAVSISTAKAESNLSLFIAELERVSHQDSLLAVTIFQMDGTPIPSSPATRARSAIISDRETLYFLRPSGTLK
ncbi:MAG TPA: class I SAM-dependent methyltransferase [Candidatus Angelobacter sp.]|nr:class I SAM-dependent methyltransferase [Candidatus Angelobacter sp.]